MIEFLEKVKNGKFMEASNLMKQKDLEVKKLLRAGKSLPEEFDCPICSGGHVSEKKVYTIKKLSCSFCQGTGRKTFTCKKCGGRGCPTCNNTGKFRTKARCPNCDNGIVFRKSLEIMTFHKCRVCDGWGVELPFYKRIFKTNDKQSIADSLVQALHLQ